MTTAHRTIRAARAARDAGEYAEALRQFERSLLLSASKRPELLLDTAEMAHLQGFDERAANLARAAIDELAASADGVALGLAHERYGRYLFQVGADRSAGRRSDWFRALERADALVPAGSPPAARARVVASLAWGRAMLGELGAAEELACEALQIAADNTGLRADILATLGVVAVHRGDHEAAIRLFTEGRDLARAGEHPLDLHRVTYNLALTLEQVGRVDEAAANALDNVGHARRVGSALGLTSALAARLLLESGRVDEADDLAADVSETHYDPFLVAIRCQIAAVRGDFDAGEAFASALLVARETWDRNDLYLFGGLAIAELRRAQGRFADAVAAVDDAVPHVLHADIEMCGLLATGTGAAADLAVRDPRARRGMIEFARAFRDRARAMATPRDDSRPVLALPAAHVATADADVHRAEGTDSEEEWAIVAETWGALGAPLRSARARLHAELARRRVGGNGAEPRPELEAARRAAHLSGAAPLAAELDRAAGVEPAAVDHRTGFLPDVLTARERDVLAHLHHGATDREIAAALGISPKTASLHVSHILHKLGVARRAQVAAMATRAPARGGDRRPPGPP
jgi:DNA-binding CsgD family transcriptional regulator/tetratricopeptide (TPR) repeat protein